ncbi:FtsZ-interacting cell division protein ZipA [Weissella uvarum]|uniref:hypothetical protein n=1 Tax=Weissella uvarum TaxID=1479233 RepID=UPI00196017DC|nr:hypothetical protein [Weissella uvarum]MBM7617164.1 FtsZ-interacting cell division protein ZipA [Weissella uvarum]MCM0595460.1 hypothetical protein [Weissella uvarum]
MFKKTGITFSIAIAILLGVGSVASADELTQNEQDNSSVVVTTDEKTATTPSEQTDVTDVDKAVDVKSTEVAPKQAEIKAAVNKVPVVETVAAKKAPVKKAPAKKAPVKKAPAKKAPVKKAPAKKTPAKKAPVKKAPAKKKPAPKKTKQQIRNEEGKRQVNYINKLCVDIDKTKDPKNAKEMQAFLNKFVYEPEKRYKALQNFVKKYGSNANIQYALAFYKEYVKEMKKDF